MTSCFRWSRLPETGRLIPLSNGAPSLPINTVSTAVFAPLRQTFDYRLDTENGSAAVPANGTRVWVPFGNSERVAVVLATKHSPQADIDRLKPILACLDDEPILTHDQLELAAWAANYYHHPLGDVIAGMLPTSLRKNRQLPPLAEPAFRITADGLSAFHEQQIRGRKQLAIAELLAAQSAVNLSTVKQLGGSWRNALARMQELAWVAPTTGEPRQEPLTIAPGPALSAEQQQAVASIHACRHEFKTIVLNGITGSGKTEVYLEAINSAVSAGRQALVLVPEIALTEHLTQRFRDRFGAAVGVLHSGLGERARLTTWNQCRHGLISVLIGTRSAVWIDFPDLGVIVVDEEHDASYKQQEGFRYSARDVAIVRAQRSAIPIILGSATPSLETLANVGREKYVMAELTQRANAATLPTIECLDVRGQKLAGGLSDALLRAMREHLARGEQVMLFLNRRGYAPILMCRQCGEPRRCPHCDAYLVYHKYIEAARCHHCGIHVPLRRPARCCDAPDVAPMGLGTEQLEEIVSEQFADYRVCRIDRDSVRQPKTLKKILNDIKHKRVDILIGTQMVAKGLDFADITLIGVIDADGRLYAVDFRAEERLAQLLIQVAGRAGRASKPGTVLVQTHHPEHPVLQRIIGEGYASYAAIALAERREIGLPPFARMAVVRADSRHPEQPLAFLNKARELLKNNDPHGLDISFPIPALMEKRAGRFRALIVLRHVHRRVIGDCLKQQMQALEQTSRQYKVRFAIDIDPQDTL